jgi:trimethylamine--corrinoid protein Co-methyltransferase
MAAYVRRILEGFEIDRERLAVEAINRVGHKGNFLEDPHTLQFLHKEKRFKPTLFEWRSYETWSKEGTTIVERAQDKLSDILTSHEVPPLEKALQRELDRILQAAERA